MRHARGTLTVGKHTAEFVRGQARAQRDVAVAQIFKVFSDPDLPFGEKADPGALVPPALGAKPALSFSSLTMRLASLLLYTSMLLPPK